jgi:predicted DNA-binding transcriptional regulator AlpA
MSKKPSQQKFDPAERFLTAKEVAERYSIHIITVYKRAKLGLLPPGELISANARRWRASELAAFEARRNSTQD